MKRYIKSDKQFGDLDKPSKFIFYNFVGKSIIPDIEFDNWLVAEQYASDHDWQVYKRWDGVSEVPEYL